MTRCYVSAWGMWFCMVDGWVDSAEKVRPISMPAACGVKEVQPGVVVLEVSA